PSTYTLSLHDALPISLPTDTVFSSSATEPWPRATALDAVTCASSPIATALAASDATKAVAPIEVLPSARIRTSPPAGATGTPKRSEEHTSELQSRENL